MRNGLKSDFRSRLCGFLHVDVSIRIEMAEEAVGQLVRKGPNGGEV